MVSIDVSKFKRDSVKINNSIKEGNDCLIAKEDLTIMFPKRYLDIGFGYLDTTVLVYGVLAIYNSKLEYAITTIPALVKITPDGIDELDINGDVYIVLTILKGNNIIDSLSVKSDPDIGFNTFDYLLVRGNVPWYIGYEDFYNLFLNIPEYGGSNIGDYLTVIRIMIAVSARHNDNPKIPYRKVLKTNKDNVSLYWAGLNNIYYTYSSTASKLFGSYMKAGMVSAIVNPEEKPTKLENIIRK